MIEKRTSRGARYFKYAIADVDSGEPEENLIDTYDSQMRPKDPIN